MGPQEVARGWNNANMDDEEVPEGYKVVFRLGSDPRTTQTSSLGYSSTQQYLHGDHISPSADPLQLVCHYPKLKALLGEIQNAKARVCIEKVKGHNGDRGNDGADGLAKDGG
ncbi:hypothetical protein FA13DRAFT_1713882 [Coprinellus micaceus]|uniref:RNase H type-1 domain-containing protein n=1 Tax=Coprinellus micaceus TaxID=71717 RepID=A0A4Y7SUU2_COPMI|nr:hypothetical protein FA13DRAFT_1713882 [Coprinellus micaceus]